ncbi:DUF6377 domain-containing protein [Sphingobacterium sp. MYb382]|uniref:DUF6377 domain-containing protein n=1 Tax=Sphingobacterium sp. MYb382 TaxID=2745278 RepID=UPI0030A58775
MHKYLFLSMLLFICTIAATAHDVPDTLLQKLDSYIQNNEVYIHLKERRIQALKEELIKRKDNAGEAYRLNQLLFKEYKAYSSDSAIHYLNANMDLAETLPDLSKVQEAQIASAIFFVRLGMYKESADLLEKMDVKALNKDEYLDYLFANRELYTGLGMYSQDSRNRRQYWRKANAYSDSLLQNAEKGSEIYLRTLEKSLRTKGTYAKALEINAQRLNFAMPNTTQYALVTFHRSLIFRKMNDLVNEKKYLILSALSDVQHGIKDNASISQLANLLMQEGDVNRAYAYIRFALGNSGDYNSRIRSSEVLTIQSIIDKEYQLRSDKKNKQLHYLLILASVLSVLLSVSVVYVYKQMKKGQNFSRKLKEINEELSELNRKLSSTNEELKKRNLEVAEANLIKEEYIAYFLDACSSYIVKLDDYRKMVHKKLQHNQHEVLFTATRDTTLKEVEFKELYANFDRMFLNLFPDFLLHFNALLLDDEQIVIKKGEVLNTEIRIYALIRLGIQDSTKIANFLGYSVNTIYNYRTKMKNKAKILRDDFEGVVRKIGAFT